MMLMLVGLRSYHASACRFANHSFTQEQVVSCSEYNSLPTSKLFIHETGKFVVYLPFKRFYLDADDIFEF
jgi:hypothetical protein